MADPDTQPIPDSFQPSFTNDGRRLAYRTVIQHRGPDGAYTEVKVDMGKRAPKTEEESNCFHADLRTEAWRVHELVRLNRLDEVRGFTAQRHKRPPSLIKKPDPALHEALSRPPEQKQMLSGDAPATE